MRKLTALAATVVAAVIVFPGATIAGGDLAKQDPVEVRLDLGKDGVDQHRYYPDKLTFETGKLYRLVIHNPSNDLGKGAKAIGEIKGAIREVEVYPGGTTEWFFVPVATGTVEMRCGIKDKDGKSHAENGVIKAVQ
jgi:hypothetical protein